MNKHSTPQSILSEDSIIVIGDDSNVYSDSDSDCAIFSHEMLQKLVVFEFLNSGDSVPDNLQIQDFLPPLPPVHSKLPARKITNLYELLSDYSELISDVSSDHDGMYISRPRL